jgi:alkylation response protein AidB-like acyl-CoA dehydrogenase
VMPGPYLATVLLGGAAIREAGSSAQRREFLPAIAEGRLKATLASTEPNARWDASGITMNAQPMRGGFTLSGSKLFVPDAHLADIIVVAARTRDGSTLEDGVSLFLVPQDATGLRVALMPSIDETRKLCEVRFDNVAVPQAALLGELHRGWPALARVYDGAAVALAAEMCGGAQRVLEMTVDYAKLREAFGKPIGSYQGVKHKCADMLVEVENSKSLTYYAAWAIDEGVADAPTAVSMAKSYASDASRKVSNAGIQLHGGIGMTWEHDLHLYMKRAKASEVAFGDATWHRERVAALIGA